MMKTIQVQLQERSYPIYIGSNLLSLQHFLQESIPAKQILIISDNHVAPHYLRYLKDALATRECHSVILPSGEKEKSFDNLKYIWDQLIEYRFKRDAFIIALGGGVIGDLAGFAAACYQRGIHFIQIPTTLLAQVDSSVGGKTAINHPNAKNMIGAFHQPSAVIIDIETLQTLDQRQYRSGLAEVIKYGLIANQDFYQWLQQHVDALIARDKQSLMFAIEQSCKIKASIVSEDEKEQSNKRVLLNFGHSFAHAIETLSGYDDSWLHGEAVACGMVLAMKLSCELGLVAKQDVIEFMQFLQSLALPVALPRHYSIQKFLDTMLLDKKNFSQDLRLVLLQKIGSAVVQDKVPIALVRSLLQQQSLQE